MESFIFCTLFLFTLSGIEAAVLYSLEDAREISNNESSSDLITLTTPILMDGYNSTYSCLHVNKDGSITFFNPVSFSPTTSSLESLGKVTPAIAPLWADTDMTVGGRVYYRNLPINSSTFRQITTDIQQIYPYFTPEMVFVATWEDVGPYNESGAGNSFQTVLLTDGISSFVMFRYRMLSWCEACFKNSPSTKTASVGVVGKYSLFHSVFSRSTGINNLMHNSNFLNHTGVYLYPVHGRLDDILDPTVKNCVEGDIRLQGGSTVLEGRVEICHQNTWRGVCNRLWGTLDANVTCQQLGLQDADYIAITSDIYGQFHGEYLLDGVECKGNEDSLLDCNSITDGFSCNTQDYASVKCLEDISVELEDICLEGSVRLVGGCSETSGRVEMCRNNTWQSVCDDSFNDVTAAITCLQLGFSETGATAHCCSEFGISTEPEVIEAIECSGLEYSLSECAIMSDNTSTCESMAVASVTCLRNCSEDETFSIYGTNTWLTTAPGERAVMDCEFDISGNFSSGVLRSCNIDGNWEAVEYYNCSMESEYILDLIKDSPVLDDNVDEVLGLLHNATSLINSTEDQTVESFSIITDAIERISDCSCIQDVEGAEYFLEVMDRISRWTIIEEEPPSIDTTRNFERTLSSSSGLSPSMFPNGVLSLSSSSITFSIIQDNASNYIDTGLTYQAVQQSNELSGNLSVNEPSSETSLASIKLPDVLFQRLGSNASFQALFVAYQNPNLFPTQNSNDTNRRVISSIMSATIHSHSEDMFANLSKDVLISLTLTSQRYHTPQCVFWDNKLRMWSSDGCKAIAMEDIQGARITCRCNHLSTFGIIADPTCAEGYVSNMDNTSCIPPTLKLIPELLRDFTPWEEISVSCESSGPLVSWRKFNTNTRIYEDIPEVNVTNSTNDLCGEDKRDILMTEDPGQLYAYRIATNNIVIGTRRSDVFGEAVGISVNASGIYQCYIHSSTFSVTRTITVNEISSPMKYIRFNVKSSQTKCSEHVDLGGVSNTSNRIVVGIVSTVLLKTLQETYSNPSPSIDCTIVPNPENNHIRIGCHLQSAAHSVDTTILTRNLPNNISLVEEQGVLQSSSGFCDYDNSFQSQDNRGSFVWNETKVGQMAKADCFYGPSTKGGSGFATRRCIGHQTWEDYDGSQCCTRLCRQDFNVTQENLDEVVNDVANTVIQLPPDEQTEENFVHLTDLYSNLDSLIQGGDIVATNNLTSSTVRVLSSVSDWPMNAIGRTSSRLVGAFETITRSLTAQESFKTVNFSQPNIDFLATKVTQSADDDGLYDHFSRPSTVVSKDTKEKSHDYLIEVPKHIVDSSDSLIYTLYETPALFPVEPSSSTDINATLEVDSMVVGFTLVKGEKEKRISGLQRPVILTFKSLGVLNSSDIARVICVSWDFRAIDLGNNTYQGNWTEEGCTLNVQESSIADGIYVCHCNHLTNFAVMVSTDAPDISDTVSTTLTYIGCFLSILGLSITMVSLIIFKNIRQKVITKFHFQLCLSLLLFYLIFMIGINQTKSEGVCSAMSFFIHYFSLVFFFWTGAEAAVMLKTFVLDVFGQITWKFVLLASIICWCGPLFFAILNVIISTASPVNYMVTTNDDGVIQYCFMNNYRVHIALQLVPMYTIIIFNIVAFILVIRVLILQTIQKQKRTADKTKDSDAKVNIRLILGICSVSVLFGIFWILGVLSVSDAAVYFQWPFIVLNTSQGIIIFLLIGLFNAQKEWKDLFLRRKKRKGKSTVPLRSKSIDTSSKSSATRFSNLPSDSNGRASRDFTYMRDYQSEVKNPGDTKVSDESKFEDDSKIPDDGKV